MTVGQLENYPFDYMAIPDEFHDNWTAKLSGDQYKIMLWLLGRLVVNKNPLTFTLNGVSKGTGINPLKIETEIKKLCGIGLLNIPLKEEKYDLDERILIGSLFTDRKD